MQMPTPPGAQQGLLSAGMQQAGQLPQGSDVMGSAEPQQGERMRATPEMQRVKDQLVWKAVDMLHSEQLMDRIVEDLGKGDPEVAIGNITAVTMLKIENAMEEKGNDVPEHIMLNVGTEVLGIVASMSEAAGFSDASKKSIEKAGYVAMDTYLGVKETQGKLDLTGIDEVLQSAGVISPDVEPASNLAEAAMRAQGVEPQQGGM